MAITDETIGISQLFGARLPPESYTYYWLSL